MNVKVSRLKPSDARKVRRLSSASAELNLSAARPKLNSNCTNTGTSINDSVTTVQYKGEPGRKSQPETSNKKVIGSIRLRRRLSNIFQREMMLIGLVTNLPDSSGTFRNSHCVICQSPRTQRCVLRVWAEY